MSESTDDESTSDDSGSEWVPYSERAEWKDVIPLPQDDGPNPIVAICYSQKFRESYDYFRAILKMQEKSERALELTKECISLNSANYTVWQYRREILQALGADLKEELKYIESVIKYNSKNYQVWHHRRVIVELMNDPSEELEFTKIILQKDSKNYHAWQYRQWIILTFKLFDNELEYTEELISQDIRNNSAWNQRYFILHRITNFDQDTVDHELDFVLSKIFIDMQNESSWSYLRGILQHDKNGGIGFNKKVTEKCQEWYNENHRENHLLAFIIDICEDRINSSSTENTFFSPDRAFELCLELSEQDKIRKRYWQYINQQLQAKLQT